MNWRLVLPRRFLQRVDDPSSCVDVPNSFKDCEVIAVGAPVFERAWILDEWFHCLADQIDVGAERLYMLFNYGPGADNTLEIIERWRHARPWAGFEVLIDNQQDHFAHRHWDTARYHTMVRLRNRLLERVRELGIRHYLSCDTDMLLPPQTLAILIQDSKGYDGMAPLAFMTQADKLWFNAMDSGFSHRPQLRDGVQRVGASFGVVLMNEHLIGVDYDVHPNGEDLGWAHRAALASMKLGLTTHVTVKHVMSQDALHRVDWRVGF